MDSKVVNREIKSVIWPLLKAAGFSKFNTRNAWRYTNEQISVINFQSFNSYNADVLGVTSFSFSVNVGCYLEYLSPTWPPKVENGRLVPSETQCHFRSVLVRSFPQPSHKFDTIWAVDKRGENLSVCMGDVAKQIPSVLNWFDRLQDKEEVLSILMNEQASMHFPGNSPSGIGNNPSPNRSYLTGYAALKLGKEVLAREKFAEAVQSKCFTHLFSSVEGAINRAI